MKIEDSGWGLRAVAGGSEGRWILRSASERPENAELGREWLGGHCEVRRTPRFQEGIDISDFRKRCAGEGL